MKILLLEDNPADARLFLEKISKIEGVHHEVIVLETLKECLLALNQEKFEAAFIDLNLPDSTGLASLHAVLACQPELPIIVLTGMDNDDMGSQAIYEGAQDYLAKDEATSSVLVRSLRHGIERKKLLLELQQQAKKAQQEASYLRDLAETTPSSPEPHNLTDNSGITSGDTSDLVSEYSRILHLAVTEQVHKTKNNHSHLLKKLVEKLGAMNATPKDIIQIHVATIDNRSWQGKDMPSIAYDDEGRMLLLETMGELASFYRSKSFPGSGQD